MNEILLLREDKSAIDAIIKKVPKVVFKHIFIIKKHLYATDGRIALRIFLDSITLSDGVYEILKSEKFGGGFMKLMVTEVPDVTAPDIETIFARIERLPKERQTMNHLEINKDDITLTRAVILLYKETGNVYSLQFLKCLAPYCAQWAVVAYKKDQSVVLERGKACAIIMPFVLD